MASDDPAFLSKGVEVSAKYKGAFCEAKVKHVEKSVKCKVILKEDGKSLIVSDEDIRGALKVGAVVEVRKQPDGGHFVEATISRITDHSLYTVIFDDGDENTLRRSKLCLKGDRHFMKSEGGVASAYVDELDCHSKASSLEELVPTLHETVKYEPRLQNWQITLDDLPLTNPEHFSTPVIRKASGSKSSKARAVSDSDDNSDSSSDSSGNEDSDCRSGSQSKSLTNERSYMKSLRDFVGQVFCVEVEDRAKKSTMQPCLVVLPSADELQLTSSRHMLVKSFKDNKFITTTFDASRLYSASIAATKMAACKDKMVKLAWEKAQQYIEHQELPTAWEKDSLLGNESDSEETSDCEVPAMDERRDMFVARLYKFMEESGTPLNKGPTLDGNDIDLFHLFELVSNMGGYNRVTNMSRWPSVFLRLKLSCSLTIGTAAKHVQDSYKKYLYAYEDINRKLGCTLVSTLNRPDRGRHPSSRSLVSFRDRERLDRPVESLLKSATRIASKRSSSIKDEPSTPTASGPDDSLLIPQLVKEREMKETEDSDRIEKPDVKPDDSQQRLTRKTPKRPQLDAPNILPASVEMKDLDPGSQVKDPTQKVAGANKPSSVERSNLIRQRRPSAVMRLTRVDVHKKAQTNVSGSSTEARSGDKKSTLGGTGGNDRHKFGGKLSIGKDARLAKKTPSDGSDSRAGKSDFKHEDKVLKRPILRRESSSSRVSADRVSVNSTTDQNTMPKEDTDKVVLSKTSSAEEGYAIGTRLRVRYGKAQNLKIYEAKVLDKRPGSGTSAVEYYVHYAGWNNRYDEWIRREAIVSIIEEPAEGVVLSTPTNVSSVATKSRSMSSIGSIISRAAEKKKAPNLYLKSYTGGLLSNAKKVRKFIDPNGGGDGQHADKVHKRMPTLNPIKGVPRQTSASSKVPHRRARTRSRTLDAEESESERSSSSDSESDAGSKGSSHMQGGSPTRSPPSLGSPKSKIQPKTDPDLPDICDTTSNSSKNMSEDKSIKEPATEVKTVVDKDESEMVKTDTLLTSLVNVSIKRESFAEEGVSLSPSKTQLESASEVEMKDEPVVHQVDAVEENDKDGSDASHVITNDATSSSLSTIEVSVKTPESVEDKTKSGRGKKRPLVETEKPDKKGKSDTKKVGKDAHASDRETDDRKESSDDSELPKTVIIEDTSLAVGEPEESKKEVLTTSKDKESTAEGDQKVSSDEESEHDSRLTKRKKSKGKTSDKTPKTVGKGSTDKPETPRAKKQVKTAPNDNKSCDVNSQDSQSSEVESTVEKDLCDAELDKEKDDTSSAVESNAQPAATSDTSPSSFDKAAAATKAAAAASLAAMSGLGMLASVSKSKDWKATLEGGSGSQDEEAQKSSSEGSRNLFEDAVKTIPSSCFREEVDTMSMLQPSSTPCHQPPMFTDSPPDSSESDEFGGPSPSGGSASPTGPTGDEERTSTKSELEANMEVAAYMGGTSNGGETSSDDDDNDDYEENRSQSRHHTKGAGIKRRSDIDLAHESFTTTSKRLKQDKQQHHHRTRASHNRLAAVAKIKTQGVSDSDDVDSTPAAPVKQSVNTATPASSGSTTTSSAHKIYRIAEPRPLTKYNFLDLEEGQYLEGEERITFLMSKIQELRQVYMDLKAEVACIDRRRRRHRMKEKEAQATHSSVNVSAVSAGGGSSAV